jgi:hypothetical protein
MGNELYLIFMETVFPILGAFTKVLVMAGGTNMYSY